MDNKKIRGQSLVEAVIALGVGVILISSASSALFLVLRSGQLAQNNQSASLLASALSDNLSLFAEANWHNIYDLNKGAANKYHIANSAGQLVIQSGEEQVAADGVVFTRYFYIENVERDAGGDIVASGGTDDLSTQKATIVTSWPIAGAESTITSVLYLTRWPNKVFQQTDWSGGSGQEGPITETNSQFASSENIDFTVTPGSIVPIPNNLNFIYVADTLNNRIQKFDHNGNFVSVFGSSGDGDGEFAKPKGITHDNAHNLFVSDSWNDRIQKFDSNGNFILKWGSGGSGDGEFSQPRDIAVDSLNNVYVIDFGNDRVQKFDSIGTFITKWGFQGSGDGQFKEPEGIMIDSFDNIYVADTKNDRIQKFNSGGGFIAKWGSTGSGDGQFISPHGLGSDDSDNIYVADSGNDRIQKFTSAGVFITKWGTTGIGEGQFRSPEDAVIDQFNYVYVVDSQNNNVQKFNSAGDFQSRWGSGGGGDGEFAGPTGISELLTQCDGSLELCYLISSVFDTSVTAGAGFNTLMWQGSQISGRAIFKIASSDNSGGPWNFSDPIYPTGPNVQIGINRPEHNNKRYIRYKLIMDSEQSNSPRVDDVILSYSP